MMVFNLLKIYINYYSLYLYKPEFTLYVALPWDYTLRRITLDSDSSYGSRLQGYRRRELCENYLKSLQLVTYHVSRAFRQLSWACGLIVLVLMDINTNICVYKYNLSCKL